MSKRKPKGTKELAVTVPNYGNPVEDGDKVVIVRDVFLHMSPSKLDDEWAAATIRYQPYVLSAVLSASCMVKLNHTSGRNIPANRTKWLSFVKDKLAQQV